MDTIPRILTLGETMLRFTPQPFHRLEQPGPFTVEVGGSESNTAIGLARLGLRAIWYSLLPDNALGHRVVRAIAAHGVDTSHVRFVPGARLGLYFLEEAPPPRSSRVIYDRQHSAFSQIEADDLPTDLFTPGSAHHLHLTGITPALSPSAAATTRRAAELAKEAGWSLSFDLNYRHALWSAHAARRGCHDLILASDILIAPLRDVYRLFSIDTQTGPERTLAEMSTRYPGTLIVLTLGAAGAIAYDPASNQTVTQPVVPAEATVGRVGGGDAFAAGFLYGYLTNENAQDRVQQSLRWAVAMAALKYTIPGDIPYVEKAEVQDLVDHLNRDDNSAGAVSEGWR